MLILSVFAPLLCSGLRYSLHVQPRRPQISRRSQRLRNHARNDLSPKSPKYELPNFHVLVRDTKRETENLLEYYLPSLAPYFPKFLHARSAPKANQYVLDMAAQIEHDDHSLMEKLKRKTSNLELMQAAAECKDHMAAGIDTTGDGLCFLMWELSQPRNLCFQHRLHKELTAAPANTPLDSYVYLDAVIKEALRCAPPIPMSLPRYVPAGGREIDGFFVPGYTIVSCQPYSVHRMDDSVFPEPDRFNPDRWLVEGGTAERNRLFFSFATGGRGCTGKK